MTINYNSTIKSLRDIVWGVVSDPLSQIEQITLLIFIKLLSERHNELERLKAKKLIFTGEYASYHFDSLSRLSGYELVDTTRKAVESLYNNPNIDEPIRRLYERSYLQVNDPRVLSLLINEINKIDITHIDMGDFYEHLLAVLGTQKEAGQFRTPRHLIEFIVDIVDPLIGERVLDPACGTAGFLTAAYTHIRDANTSQEARSSDSYLDKLNFDQKTFLLNKTIFGFDIDPKMIKFAISNLYLHNIKNPNISQHNTLTSNDSWEEKYDVILTNPPFSTPKGGVKPTDRFTLDSNRTEVLFAEYVIEHLTLNGRAGVIVPEGIIFQSGKAYKELRKWLVENNYLYAVVSLPSGVFNPYSGVKTCILLIDRGQAQKSDKILFCKVDNDGFDLGAQRRPIDKNDLPEVLRVVKEYKADPVKPIDSKLAYSVSKDKIVKSGDYNLTSDRYKETASITNQKWPMVKLEEVLDYEQPTNYIVNSVDYNNKFPVPVLTAGKSFILGYTNEKNGIFQEKLPVIIFDDFTTAIKYVDFPFKVKSSAMKILHAKKDRANIKFLFYAMQKIEFISNIHKRYWISEYSKIKIPLPSLSAQQQIVDELDGYQKIIDGAKQVVNNYKPKIEIDQAWKKVTIGELCELYNGKAFKPSDWEKEESGGLPIIRIQNLNNDNSEYNYFAGKTDNQVIVNNGDLLFSWSGSRGTSFGPHIWKEQRAILNQHIFKVVHKDNILKDFFYLTLRDSVKEVEENLHGGVGLVHITKGDLERILIPLPSLETQRQIVTRIEEEQKLVEANKKLIQLFEQKIKDKMEEV